MAKLFTPTDIHALMNELVLQATGQKDVTVFDASSFVSAGELVLATGTENVLNSLGIVFGRRRAAVRPYNAKLHNIDAVDSGLFSNVLLKDSFYSRDSQASGAFNTDLFTNLKTGFTAGENVDGNGDAQSTKSQWEQNLPVPLEMHFGVRDTWQDVSTIPEIQIQQAFHDEDSFNEFVSGYMMERNNDLESQKEAFNRLALVNHIAAVYDFSANMPQSVVNLTSAFNTEFGTSYTSAQLRTTYLKEFMEFFTAKIKIDSDRMTNRSKRYHWSPAKTIGNVSYTLLRHTPKDRQKLFLYAPLFVKAQSYVFPEIFNPQYLDIRNYEGVDYWQAELTPEKIHCFPAIPNTVNGGQTKGAEVELDYVVGMLFDRDGLMIDYQLDSATSTPVEARKHYRNLWYTYMKGINSDLTENCIIYIMEDPANNG